MQNVVWAKTHYDGPKWAIESSFLDTISSVFSH
jgi:hypothetical protein